jgi:glycosyltransferase involved in cell wall biosynthesis
MLLADGSPRRIKTVRNLVKRNPISLSREALPTIWLVLDLHSNKKGSFEDQLVALADRLRLAPLRATFVFDIEVPAWLDAALAARGVETRTLEFRKGWRAAAQFAGWMVAERPSLVHFHFVRAYSPMVLAARAVGARVVLHDHMTLGQALVPVRTRGRMEARLARLYKQARAALFNSCVDLRVAVSDFVAESVVEAEHVRREQVTVLENGIDVSRFMTADSSGVHAELGLAEGTPLIVCASRLSPEKGVDVLIEAFPRLRARDARLLLVSHGPDADKCRALAERLGVADRVHFLGTRSDIPRLFHAASAVVVPSLWDEAFGLVVVEAMATGRPVVVTRGGAMPAIVDDGRCGLVVPKRDLPALAQALDRILADPAYAAQLGAAAQRRACEHYAIGHWVEGMCRIYDRILPAGRLGSVRPFVAPPTPVPPARVTLPLAATG